MNILEALTHNARFANKTLSRKDYPAYFAKVDALFNALKDYHRNATEENENAAYSAFREYSHTIGKVNGAYISATDKASNGKGEKASGIFMLAYAAVLKNRAIDITEAAAEATAKHAAALKALNENTDPAKLEKLRKAEAAAKKAKEAIRNEADNRVTITAFVSVSSFYKVFEVYIRNIIADRFAMTEEQVKAMQKQKNAERDKKRGKGKAKPAAKKPATVKKPAAKTEAAKPATVPATVSA